MSTHNSPPDAGPGLGPVIKPQAPPPSPEWRPYKPGMQINSKGQVRTDSFDYITRKGAK